MCGIAGIIDCEKTIHVDFLNRLNKRMAHRGPDDSGTFIYKNVGFAHHRLSIIDLSKKGHQPMTSICGRYIVIFNGEIYNYKELKSKLVHKYQFQSHTDTETILYGFQEYGEQLFSMLNGIFAISILDVKTEVVYLVRDQFGVKPLYYYQKGSVLLFASEIKSMLEYENIDKTINSNALVDYVNFLWSPGENTPFLYVKKLLPGHFIKAHISNVSQLEISQYYDIPFKGKYNSLTEKELVAQLQVHLEKAVERQLEADVPVGFFLSGGLDSSAIVAIAKKLYPEKNYTCYTINSGEQESEGFSTDLYYARKVAQHLNVNLKEISINKSIIKSFDDMIYHLDEPQADAAPLNVMSICKSARADGIKVLLGGVAGDDLFSGYRRHQMIAYEFWLKLIPSFLGDFIRLFIKWFDVSNPFIRRARKVLDNLNKSTFDRMFGYYSWIDLKKNKSMFKYALNDKIVQDYNPNAYFKMLWDKIGLEHSLLNKSLYWELKTFLPDHNLNYTDKMAMMYGVEVRVPFLDLELVNFTTSIDPRYKMKGGECKYILKKAMEAYLPKEVIYRSKTGFGAPVRDWVKHDLDEKINRVLSQEAIEKRGLFNAKEVTRLIEDNKSGKVDGAYTIWSLLAIESWMRQFKD